MRHKGTARRERREVGREGEERDQRSEGRRQMTEDRRQMAEVKISDFELRISKLKTTALRFERVRRRRTIERFERLPVLGGVRHEKGNE